MQNWFECKVNYTKIDEKTGKDKKVTEPYLVDAVSFTEAEERIYREMEAYISGEFKVKGIRPANFTDIVTSEDGDRWYKAKISFIAINEDSGSEKTVFNNMLVCASSIDDATANIEKALDGMTVDFKIVSVSESPILDFFPYSDNKQAGEKGKQLAIKREQRVASMKKHREESLEPDEEESEDGDDD